MRDNVLRRPLRWLSAVAIFAFVPKCFVCLAAYAGVGALLGVKLGGPEICGGFARRPGWMGITLAGAAFGAVACFRFTPLCGRLRAMAGRWWKRPAADGTGSRA